MANPMRSLGMMAGMVLLAAPVFAQTTPTPAQTEAEAKAAEEAKANIDVTDAWVRATPGGSGSAAVYLRIVNVGKQPDILAGAKTENAEKADIHATVNEGGVAKMSMSGPVTVPAGGTVTFAPGGRHIMLTGLKAPLRESESFFAKLIFKNAGEKTVVVKVLAANATGLPAVKPQSSDMTSGVSEQKR